MTVLLDVNVLIALAWPNHVHHVAAWEWFGSRLDQGWATCPLTEAGFVRISSNPAATRHSVTPLDAIDVLTHLTQLGNHAFWPLDMSILHLPASIRSRLQGHRQITDALLLAAAMQRNGQLATLDAAMESLVEENARPFLSVVPV